MENIEKKLTKHRLLGSSCSMATKANTPQQWQGLISYGRDIHVAPIVWLTFSLQIASPPKTFFPDLEWPQIRNAGQGFSPNRLKFAIFGQGNRRLQT